MRWIVLFGLLAVAEPAAVRKRDIPVQVVYEQPVEGRRNLEAKPQLSPEEFEVQTRLVAKIVTPDNPNAPLVLPPNFQPYPAVPSDVYNRIQEIILTGSNRIKSALENQEKPELIVKVNASLEEFLENTKKVLQLRGVLDLKQEQNQNIFQQILSNFQSVTSGLFAAFGNNPPGGEQTNPITGFFNQMQSGIQQIANNIGGGSTPATVLSDASTSSPPGPVQFVQNAFGQIQQSVQGFLQGGTPTPAPSGFNTDTTTGSGLPQAIQSAFQQIQNLNPFQPTTKNPALGNQDPTTPGNNPLQFIQNAIGNLNPFNQQSSTQSPIQSIVGQITPTNPISGLNISDPTSIAQSIQGAISNASTSNAGPGQIAQQIQGALQSNNTNPAQIAQQIQGAIQSNNTNPGQIAQQIQGAIGGIGGSSTTTTSVAPPRSEATMGPLQSALQNINPFRRRTTKAPEAAATAAAPAVPEVPAAAAPVAPPATEAAKEENAEENTIVEKEITKEI